MNDDESTKMIESLEIRSLSLHTLFNDLLNDAAASLPRHDATIFSRISNQIPLGIQEVQCRGDDIFSFAFLLLVASINNAREQSPIVIDAKVNRYTLDLTFSFTPNPMFVLLSKGTREALEKDIETETLLNASDPFITFHLARKIGTRLHVNLWVETIPPDKAVIHAYFPLHLPSIPEEGKAPSILIIEDNRQISMLLELYLKHDGYETYTALNGIDGIQAAVEHTPDLITLDVMMPEMDGWQALRELKTIPETRHIPIVVISVLRDVQVGFEFGASDYLTKPVNRADLIDVVNSLLAQYRDHSAPPLGSNARVRLCSMNSELRSGIEDVPGIRELAFADTSTDIVDSEIVEGEGMPDVFVVDTHESVVAGIAAACRVRLHGMLDDKPVVAAGSEKQATFLKKWACCILTSTGDVSRIASLFKA